MVKGTNKDTRRVFNLKDTEKLNRKIFPEDVKKINKLREQNLSFSDIADELKISKTSARYWYIKTNDLEKFERDSRTRKSTARQWYLKKKKDKDFKARIKRNNKKRLERIIAMREQAKKVKK